MNELLAEPHREDSKDIPLLELIRRAQGNDDASFTELATRSKDWILKRARYALNRHRGTGLAPTDLLNDGYIGLHKALQNYDPDRGANIWTYAERYVDERLKTAINQYDWTMRDGRSGEYLTVHRSAYLSGEAAFDDDGPNPHCADALPLEDALAANISRNISEYAMTPESMLDLAIANKRVRDAISALPAREREYITYRYYQSRYPRGEDAAEHFEISRQEARRLQEHAYDRLRKILKRTR